MPEPTSNNPWIISPLTRRRARIPALLILLTSLPAWAQDGYKPTRMDQALYIQSTFRDAEGCALSLEDGRAVPASKAFRNPSMSCPDMFSWLLFTEVVQEKFWTDWADEKQNWPEKPYALCAPGQTGPSCCAPGHAGNSKEHCPIFPADQTRGERTAPPLRVGQPSLMDHFRDGEMDLEPELLPLRFDASERLGALSDGDECPSWVIDRVIPEDYESVGRVIRQTTAEITVRNRQFHEYLFANNLYNLDGMIEIFKNNAENIPARAPYRRQTRSAEGNKPADLTRIDLPPDAIMIKSNWLHEALAKKLELPNDPDHPWITKRLATKINFEQNGEAKSCLLTGTHQMVAFHISSKDIPKWVWTTFEHVMLPGRCDFTGCNDAYGFRSSDALPTGAADNYIKPLQRNDELNSPVTVFDRDKLYAVEAIRPNLKDVLDGLGIGNRPSNNPDEPTPADVAWRSYRLKGSQIEYTDLEGRATILGNSVIEGGFMDGSSCITCHARAGLHVRQDGSATMFNLGVFSNALSDFGYQRSHFGVPSEDWFLSSNRPPALQVLQTDFTWGFFHARPVVKP